MINKKGFTLVEVLIAMAIIALLIGLAVFGITAAFRSARDTQRRNFAQDIANANAEYTNIYKQMPDTICVDDTNQKIKIGLTQTNCANTADIELDYPDQFTNVEVTTATPTSYDTESLAICYDTEVVMVYLEGGGWQFIEGNENSTSGCPV